MTKDCTQPLRENLRPAQTTKEGHSLKGLGIDLDLNWTEMSCYYFWGPNELGPKNEVADFFSHMRIHDKSAILGKFYR